MVIFFLYFCLLQASTGESRKERLEAALYEFVVREAEISEKEKTLEMRNLTSRETNRRKPNPVPLSENLIHPMYARCRYRHVHRLTPKAALELTRKRNKKPESDDIHITCKFPLKPPIYADDVGMETRETESGIELEDNDCPQLYQGRDSADVELWTFFALPGYENKLHEIIDNLESQYRKHYDEEVREVLPYFYIDNLYDEDNPPEDIENFRLHEEDRYHTVRAFEAKSCRTDFQYSINELPPIVADVEDGEIPREYKQDFKFQADQTLGRVEGNHFEDAKKQHQVYEAIRFELKDEDTVMSCEEKYYRLRRGEKPDIEKIYRAGPTRVTAANTNMPKVREFNNQFEVAYEIYKIEIEKLQEEKEKVRKMIDNWRSSGKAEATSQLEKLKNQLQTIRNKMKNVATRYDEFEDEMVEHYSEIESTLKLDPEWESSIRLPQNEKENDQALHITENLGNSVKYELMEDEQLPCYRIKAYHVPEKMRSKFYNIMKKMSFAIHHELYKEERNAETQTEKLSAEDASTQTLWSVPNSSTTSCEKESQPTSCLEEMLWSVPNSSTTSCEKEFQATSCSKEALYNFEEWKESRFEVCGVEEDREENKVNVQNRKRHADSENEDNDEFLVIDQTSEFDEKEQNEEELNLREEELKFREEKRRELEHGSVYTNSWRRKNSRMLEYYFLEKPVDLPQLGTRKRKLRFQVVMPKIKIRMFDEEQCSKTIDAICDIGNPVAYITEGFFFKHRKYFRESAKLARKASYRKSTMTRYYTPTRDSYIWLKKYEVDVQFRDDHNQWTNKMEVRVMVVEGDQKDEDIMFLGGNFLRKIKPYIYNDGKYLYGRVIDTATATSKGEMFEIPIPHWVKFNIVIEEGNSPYEMRIQTEMIHLLFEEEEDVWNKEWIPKKKPCATNYMIEKLHEYVPLNSRPTPLRVRTLPTTPAPRYNYYFW